MKAIRNYALTALAMALLASGCGGGSNGASTQTGNFINSPTKGIRFVASPSGLTGVTDENGQFTYRDGDTVTFSLDLGSTSITLGSVTNPSTTTSILSLTVPNGGNPLAVAQVLETLDKSPIDGKMDVSGITLPNNSAAIGAIASAISAPIVSSASVATIANAVQTVLSSTNAGTLKNGSAGVSASDAMNNLAKNSANQALLNNKIQTLAHDGRSTLLDIQDKIAFTNWIIKVGGFTSYYARFGQVTSGGTFDFRSPSSPIRDNISSGTYTTTDSDRTGNWRGETNGAGTFVIKNSDSNSYVVTYTSPLNSETGSISGAFLHPLTLNDVKSKSYLVPRGCANGLDNTISINANGYATDTCRTGVHGSTWSSGPFPNTLKYIESNGVAVHYVGLTRLNRNNGAGNLPSGAVGAFVDISNFNYYSQPTAISFVVR